MVSRFCIAFQMLVNGKSCMELRVVACLNCGKLNSGRADKVNFSILLWKHNNTANFAVNNKLLFERGFACCLRVFHDVCAWILV